MNKLIALLSLGLTFSLPLAAQEKNSLLWEIQSPGGETSYLFGTYHLVGSDYLDANPKVKKAYQNSETVVVETVIDSSQLMQIAMVGMMPDNSLRQLLDSTDYLLVKEEIEDVMGLNIGLLDKMKPMTISAMYAMALAQEATPEDFHFSGKPIDLFFASDGKKQGKNVRQLETMLEQAELLYNSSTVEEQAEVLVQMVREKDEGEDLTEEILKAYQEEDLDEMWATTLSLGNAIGDLSVLVDNRNLNWIPILKPILEEGNAFIAVGALHLPGDNGLIELLMKEGYKLSPVE